MSDTRPTPETDAIRERVMDGNFDLDDHLRQQEKLERERDEAREAKLGLCRLSTEETWRKVCEANALRAHIDELQTLLPDDTTIKHGIEKLKHERDELAKWKDEQMFVESQWNAQAVAKELGLPLGTDIRKNILPAIRQLKSERDTMLESIEEINVWRRAASHRGAMIEAIRQAHDALLRVSECKIFYSESMDIDNYTTEECESALAKLKPFLP